MSDVDLVAIVGSLRAGSLNRALMETARDLLPGGVALTEIPLADVPFYNGDVDAAGDPAAVAVLKRAVESCDGLLVVTPEYNRSVPAVTKNAVDWLSRPFRASALSHAKVGIVAGTPGGHDAAGVREHLAVSIGLNTPHLYPTSLGLGGLRGAVEDGRVVDPAVRDRLAEWLDGFLGFLATPTAI